MPPIAERPIVLSGYELNRVRMDPQDVLTIGVAPPDDIE